MTAKADIITGDNPQALQVPSVALRYQPQGVPQPSGSHVWVPAGGSIRPVSIRVGVSNEGMTEIVGGNLSEGETIVVGDAGDRAGGSPAIASRVAGWIEPLQAALAGLANR
jgi:HlyD family secretion protein